MLDRAIETTKIVLEEMEEDEQKIVQDWRLNERHYGKLQGKDK